MMMHHHLFKVFILSILLASKMALAEVGRKDYQFAARYLPEAVLTPSIAHEFLKEYFYWESQYFKIARKSGILVDGWNLDYKTLQPLKIREHTAPSKEALDLMVLVKALAGNEYATSLVSENNDPIDASNKVLDILQKKIDAYQSFNDRFPGYGGFLPWIKINDDGSIEPAFDWNYRVPSLDNGEWVWAIYATYKTLFAIGESELAARYHNYFRILVKNAPILFYDFNRRAIRGETFIHDIHSLVNPSNYYTPDDSVAYFLSDVHEGLMMIYFMSLFTDLAQSEIDHLWHLIAFEKIETLAGTVYKAWPEEAQEVGSPHIKWTRLMLPEFDEPMALKVSRNQEVLRSNLYKYCLPVSTNTPGAIGYTPFDESICAPYAAFSMIFQAVSEGHLLDSNVGLSWLAQMLRVDKLQGPFGGGESFSVVPGTHHLNEISFLLTADGKVLIWAAVMGGIVDEVRQGLKEDGLYSRFMEIVHQEYAEAFGGVEAIVSSGDYQLPEAAIEGQWEPHFPPATSVDVPLLLGIWRYKPGLENWGDKTRPYFEGDRVEIAYIPGDDPLAWGWAGASLETSLVPMRSSALFLKGVGDFTLRLESDRPYIVPFEVPVQLRGQWVRIPLRKAAGNPYSVLILDRISSDITLTDLFYSVDRTRSYSSHHPNLIFRTQ